MGLKTKSRAPNESSDRMRRTLAATREACESLPPSQRDALTALVSAVRSDLTAAVREELSRRNVRADVDVIVAEYAAELAHSLARDLTLARQGFAARVIEAAEAHRRGGRDE